LNKFCVITFQGLEQFCVAELRQKGIEVLKVSKGAVFIGSEPPRLASAVHVLRLVDKLEGVKSKHFMVKIKPYDSELETKWIEEFKAQGAILDYKTPEFVLRVFPDLGVKGLDSSKEMLSKRDYRVFTTRNSLNAVSAYALGCCTFEKPKAGFIVTSDGAAAIEAALAGFAQVPVFGMDAIVLSGAKKNAIVAEAELQFHKSWEGEFDSIGIALNFKRSAGRTPESILKQIIKVFNPKRLCVLTLPQFSGLNLQDYKASVTPFWQGKLGLCLIAFSR